jgi:hypothetical protein
VLEVSERREAPGLGVGEISHWLDSSAASVQHKGGSWGGWGGYLVTASRMPAISQTAAIEINDA